MTTVTKKNLSMTRDAIRKRAKRAEARRAKEYEFYRNNPAALAGKIAQEIRVDQHANEDPLDYDNGGMHWFQNQWATFKGLTKNHLTQFLNDAEFGEKQLLVEIQGQCPTTGCVAGWAATLTGNSMIIQPRYWQTSLEDVARTVESDGYVRVDDCKDYKTHQVDSIMNVGAAALGLSYGLDNWLFSVDRHQAQVLWALDKLAEGETFDPDWCPFDESGNPIVRSEDGERVWEE